MKKILVTLLMINFGMASAYALSCDVTPPMTVLKQLAKQSTVTVKGWTYSYLNSKPTKNLAKVKFTLSKIQLGEIAQANNQQKPGILCSYQAAKQDITLNAFRKGYYSATQKTNWAAAPNGSGLICNKQTKDKKSLDPMQCQFKEILNWP